MSPKIGILAGRSLFAEGMISRMRRSYPLVEFELFSPCSEASLRDMLNSALDVLVLIQPPQEFIARLQSGLYASVSHLKMIVIEPQSDRARILEWNEQPVNKVDDIMSMINHLVDDHSILSSENY